MLSNERLPHDVRVAIVEFKNALKTGVILTAYKNWDNGLPQAPVGQTYYEWDVGEAHAGDPEPRGKRRLVALVDAGGNILKVYFTDTHYTLGLWKQLQFP
jgi:hypothetical protein